MDLLISSAFALSLCPLAETTKTCRKMELGSLTPYHLICWQTNGFRIYWQVYERALSWHKKKKKEQKKRKRNSLQRSIKFALWVSSAKKTRVKHIYLANYILPTFWGWCGWSTGRVQWKIGTEENSSWVVNNPRRGKEEHRKKQISACLC